VDPWAEFAPEDIRIELARVAGGGPCQISITHEPTGVRVDGGDDTPAEKARLLGLLAAAVRQERDATQRHLGHSQSCPRWPGRWDAWDRPAEARPPSARRVDHGSSICIRR